METRNLKCSIYWGVISAGVALELVFINFLLTGEFVIKALDDLMPSTIALLVVVLLSHILFPDIKEKFIFFRLNNALPGCRVFTTLLPSDPRIDYNKVLDKYKNIPEEGSLQNALWFEIYKRYKYESTIFSLHKLYLSMRDTFAALFAITFTAPIFLYVFYGLSVEKIVIFIGWNFIFLFLVALIAKDRGERFVTSVIVHDLS